jgi:hypothetical protein
LVFQGGDMNGRNNGAVDVIWTGTRNLAVGFCYGRTSVFRNWWANWSVNPQDEIAVSLVQEAPGRWPANVPPARQAGPPPCN